MTAARNPAEPWDTEWAAEKASEALHYLARNYPECAALEVLREHEEAAHGAAVRGDRDAYLEALREYCRAGRDEALRNSSGSGLMLRKAKVCVLDQLLLERYCGKVGWGLAVELSRRK
jgi:hypothetical protein